MHTFLFDLSRNQDTSYNTHVLMYTYVRMLVQVLPFLLHIHRSIHLYYIFIDPEDYANGTYQVVFPPGESSAVIQVPINDDDVCERNETFVVMLVIPKESAVYGVRAGIPREATVTIEDDDSRLTNSAFMCALVCIPHT